MSQSSNGETIAANEQFNEGLRLGLAARLGNLHNFGDDDDLRDHYETFGWPKDPDDDDYLALYLRNAFARVVVDKPAFATWRVTPDITDDTTDEDTDFEQDITRLFRSFDLRSYFERVDRVAGVGEHGLLVMSFSDVTDNVSAWATDARDAGLEGLDDLNMFKPLLQTQIDEIEWGGRGSERWGKPTMYHIDWSEDVDDESDEDGEPFKIHWTRVIDVPATRLLDDETLARPRTEPVLNNLLDIEKELGSAAELSYRGADYGLHLNWDPTEVNVDELDKSEVRDELQRWYHGLQPELKTVGAELTTLGGDTVDPKPVIEPNLWAIYAQTGIPKREFIGNQQGEQAGAEQDEKSYLGTITERAEHYATPHIVRRTIDRLRDLGILSEMSGATYMVEWPDRTELSEVDQSEVAYNRARALKNAAPQGNTDLMPGGMGGVLEYMNSGELPDDLEVEQVGNAAFDESHPEVQDQFNQVTSGDR